MNVAFGHTFTQANSWLLVRKNAVPLAAKRIALELISAVAKRTQSSYNDY